MLKEKGVQIKFCEIDINKSKVCKPHLHGVMLRCSCVKKTLIESARMLLSL